MYFDYSFANEDTRLETNILPMNSDCVAAIAGSGSRIVPLLSKRPKRLVCIDISEPQLSLTEFRLKALEQLDYQQYLQLVGYENVCSSERRQLFHCLSLSDRAREYTKFVYNARDWGPILFEGRWERANLRLSRVFRFFCGKHLATLFECKNLSEQLDYLENYFPWTRWNQAISLISYITALSISRCSEGSIQKNIPMSYRKVLSSVMKKQLLNFHLRNSFYANLLLLGDLRYKSAWPIEAQETYFDKAQSGMRECNITMKHVDVIRAAKTVKHSVNFLSLSNVASYFNAPHEQRFLQAIKPAMASNGLVISRSFLKVPFRVDTIGFENLGSLFDKDFQSESTQLYHVDIYRKLAFDEIPASYDAFTRSLA